MKSSNFFCRKIGIPGILEFRFRFPPSEIGIPNWNSQPRPKTRDRQSKGTSHGDTLCHHASSVNVRIAIQDALVVDILSLHVNYPCDESSQRRVMAVTTPDGECSDANGDCGDANGDCSDAESDDEDYSHDPVTPPKKQEKRVKNKLSDQKVILDRNFMTILQPETFRHEPFRKGSSKMYSKDDID